MSSERENLNINNGLGALRMRAYNVAENKIRGFFDAADNLVFVIDDTITDDKPNALLVINPDRDRKWDDILSKDYGVLLEAVRPKKDNKYQKLDIEYSGLGEYDNLIRDYDDGIDIADALNALRIFRANASQRAAADRLKASETAADKARDTIKKANDAISELQERAKEMRSKLARQRKEIGREPTKQSAAKILRTESQIDALKEKQKRAQRRLDSARRRLVAAEEDAEIARGILARHGVDQEVNVVSGPGPVAHRRNRNEVMAVNQKSTEVATQPSVVVVPQFNNITVGGDDVAENNKQALPVPNAPIREIFTEQTEQKAKKMADEEVKPLFDKDPEILDEEIAFKPIDFDVKVSDVEPTVSAEPRFDDFNKSVAPTAPLSFAPPVMGDDNHSVEMASQSASPVLDTIRSVEMPVEPVVDSSRSVGVDVHSGGYNANNSVTPASAPDAVRPEPISPAVPGVVSAPVRPVSPVTGMPARPVDGGKSDGKKPTFLYYILLIALIVLSIFTLWLYQKKNSETVPDLAATTTVKEEEPTPVKEQETPFIAVEETVSVEPEPVVVAEPEPEPVVEEPVAPVIDETVPAIPVVAEPEPEPLSVETPFITEPEPEPEPVKPVVVNKPAYNAGSQNENMFVADTQYDTDVPEVQSAPVDVPVQYEETVTTEYNSVATAVCDDGSLPDMDGCCGDEQYTDIGDGSFLCCSQSTGDCYPPM